MRFVEEIVVDEFLPTVRSMLAAALRERGLTQAEVAEALGVSQSAVSKYAHGGVGRNERVAGHDRVRETVERVADGLVTGDLSRVGALVELEVLVRELESGGLLTDLHEAAEPGLADHGGYDVHDPEGAVRTAEQVRSSVRRGLRTLTTAGGFAARIPAVGSNLVECLPDATDIEDVAGVPGRIFDVKGRATVPADPEFGVSGHVAGVLLAARAAGLPVRAALDVAYEPAALAALADAGLATVEFDPAADAADDTVRAAVERALVDAGAGAGDAESAVVYHTGAVGVEPIVYVLGPDAPAVATLVRERLC
jgi:predicted fused transcriptional regulator/phosphomethylpyrimidine kinase/predicted transcriptional regulator